MFFCPVCSVNLFFSFLFMYIQKEVNRIKVLKSQEALNRGKLDFRITHNLTETVCDVKN